MANFCGSFCQAKRVCTWYYMNKTIAYESLQGPIERFNSIEWHEQKVNIKTCWAAAMWLANGNPRTQNLVLRFTVFEFSKKHYIWPCFNWWTIMNNSKVGSFESVVFKNWRRNLNFAWIWKWLIFVHVSDLITYERMGILLVRNHL